MFSFSSEQFSGPLDLLLQMIEGDKLKVTDVSLMSVTDAYIEHVKSSGSVNESEMADFLIVAAKLLYIKSKELLPQIVVDDETGIDLTRQLKMYEQFARAAEEVKNILLARRHMYPREPLGFKIAGFYPPKTVTATKLGAIMRLVIDRNKPEQVLEEVRVQKVMSISEKIESVQKLLKNFKKATLTDLVTDPHSRADIIVTFLALLELVKTRNVTLDQRAHFDHIYVAPHEYTL